MINWSNYGGLDSDLFFEIIDSMYDELLVYDGNYNIIYINQACKRHYNVSPEEMIGKNFLIFMKSGGAPLFYRQFMKQKKPWLFVRKHIRIKNS